jgi:hypothetical protein
VFMLSILRIKQCHERPRIYQDQRRNFLLTVCCTPWRVAVEGATA